jgi:hypothetical protein
LLSPEGPVALCQSFVKRLLAPLSKCTVILERGEELLVALDEDYFLTKSSSALLRAGKDSEQRSSCEKEAVEALLIQIMRTQSFSEYLLSLVDDVQQKQYK